MKKMKKLFAMLLALSMVMSLMSMTAFAAEGRFSCDCADGHKHIAYEEGVESCYERQLVCELEYDVVCGKDEHTHDADECFVPHEHAEACKDLICEIPEEKLVCEADEHTHSEKCCVIPVKEQICEDESPEHEHTDECYDIHEHGDACEFCDEPEHTHSDEDACYEYHTHEGIKGEEGEEGCWEYICGLEVGEPEQTCPVKEEHTHIAFGEENSCYEKHEHKDDCYEAVLVCEESVFHIHTAACFAKKNGASWPSASVCMEPTCEYAGMEIYGHKYSCLSEETREAIIASYPSYTHKVKAYEEPYVFAEAQTYLISGHRFHDTKTSDYIQFQLFMIADWSDLEAGESWTYEGGKRFELGESDYTVAYCCDVDTPANQYHMYRQVNLEDAGYYDEESAQKIRAVMLNSYPYLSMEELQADLEAAGYEAAEEVDEVSMIAGTQLAIWSLANPDVIDDYHYYYTGPSGKYPALTAYWEKGDAKTYQPEADEHLRAVADYLLELAEENPEEAPASEIVVSQVEVTNLVMVPNEDGETFTVTLEVSLNTEYEPHAETDITITAVSGDAETSVSADGSSVYTLVLEGYKPGQEIEVTMSGQQYLPAGVYFFEPYTKEGQDVRKVSQNLVGLNVGTVPVGDRAVLNPASLQVEKVDEEGDPLTGASFTLSYVDADGKAALEIGTYEVDEDGKLMLEGLMAGASYELEETVVPEGYEAPDEPIRFHVSGDGSGEITLLRKVSGVDLDEEAKLYILTVENRLPDNDPPDDDDDDPPPPKKDQDKEKEKVTIDDSTPPLADIKDDEVPLDVLEDNPVPLVPKTGDISALWLALSALSGTGLAGVSVIGRRKRDEE